MMKFSKRVVVAFLVVGAFAGAATRSEAQSSAETSSPEAAAIYRFKSEYPNFKIEAVELRPTGGVKITASNKKSGARNSFEAAVSRKTQRGKVYWICTRIRAHGQ